MALPPAIAVGLTGMPLPMPKSFDVTGVMGNIGEWEVTAALARDGDTREFSGSDESKAHRLVQPGRPTREDRRAADQAGAAILIDCCKGPSRRR